MEGTEREDSQENFGEVNGKEKHRGKREREKSQQQRKGRKAPLEEKEERKVGKAKIEK